MKELVLVGLKTFLYNGVERLDGVTEDHRPE